MQLYHRAAELLWSRSLTFFFLWFCVLPILLVSFILCWLTTSPTKIACVYGRVPRSPFRLPVSALLSLQFLICALAFCVLLVSPNRNVRRCTDAGWRRDRRRVAPLVRAESLCFSHLVWLVWFCLGSLELVCLLYYLLPRRLSCVSEFQSLS